MTNIFRRCFTKFCIVLMPLTMICSYLVELDVVVSNQFTTTEVEATSAYQPIPMSYSASPNPEIEVITLALDPIIFAEEITDEVESASDEVIDEIIEDTVEVVDDRPIYEQYGLTWEEYDLLARVAYAEAGNQDNIGKRLVVDAILNRVDSENFPNNIRDVVYQSGQFSTASYLYNDSLVSPTEAEYAAVDAELVERYNYEVIYFRTKHYHTYGTQLFQHGDHFFNAE